MYQVGVATLIVALIWMVMGIFAVSLNKSQLDIDKSILEPINPKIDQEVITALTSRIKIEENVASESANIEEGGIR
jgi:hypothetical protein